MVRELTLADTVGVLRMLRERPIANVFLEHVVRAIGVGRVPGLFGIGSGREVRAVMLVGPLGGTVLAVRDDDDYVPLAEFAARLPVPPRHLVGPEDVTERFWRAFTRHADPVLWTRREPVYVLHRSGLGAETRRTRIEVARERDVVEIVENSRCQYREDLRCDRWARDAQGFRQRHRADVRAGRWFVLRSRGRIAFQVHVGPRNASVVQVGGVFTRRDLRGRGWASRGMRALGARLLDTHPAVSLFCDEANLPARHAYERAGFEPLFHYRSWLLADAPARAQP